MLTTAEDGCGEGATWQREVLEIGRWHRQRVIEHFGGAVSKSAILEASGHSNIPTLLETRLIPHFNTFIQFFLFFPRCSFVFFSRPLDQTFFLSVCLSFFQFSFFQALVLGLSQSCMLTDTCKYAQLAEQHKEGSEGSFARILSDFWLCTNRICFGWSELFGCSPQVANTIRQDLSRSQAWRQYDHPRSLTRAPH